MRGQIEALKCASKRLATYLAEPIYSVTKGRDTGENDSAIFGPVCRNMIAYAALETILSIAGRKLDYTDTLVGSAFLIEGLIEPGAVAIGSGLKSAYNSMKMK